MVKGINKFKEHFQNYSENFRIIGGTACDLIISAVNFIPRATKDIDLLIVLEKYNAEFNKKLWEFINAAGYKSLQKEMKQKCFYRFCDPFNQEYPYKLELICRDPQFIQIPEGSIISPIDPNEYFYHLSVMVMNNDYYELTIKYSYILDGLSIARPEALICLKALAYQNLLKDKQQGKHVNSDDLTKHKYDVFRLSVLLDEISIEIPAAIKTELENFLVLMENERPDVNSFLKHMLVDDTTLENLTNVIRKKFNIMSMEM